MLMTKVRWAVGAFALLVSLVAVNDRARSRVAVTLFFHIPGQWFGPFHAIGSLLWLRSWPAPFAPPRDYAERLCELTALFRNNARSFTVITAENVERFKASCLKVLPTLENERWLELERRMSAGDLHPMLEAMMEVPDVPPFTFRKDFASCAAGAKRMEEHELEDEALRVFNNTGMLPLKARHVEPHEVADALKRSEVVTFDGRSLLPERVFNTTVAQLRDLHPHRDISVHSYCNVGVTGFQKQDCWMVLNSLSQLSTTGGLNTLLYWLLKHGLYEAIMADQCDRVMTLREMAELLPHIGPKNWEIGTPGWMYERRTEEAYDGINCAGANINVMRLSNWHKGEFDAKKLLAKVGLEGQADYAHNLLWFGSAPGGAHFDHQDNILVQLQGVSYAVVVPANCSFSIPEHEFGSLQVTTAEWFLSKGPDFPFWIVKLKPGDGVAIPSNSLHSIMSRDPGRIGMNFFAEPSGKGRMHWPWAPASYFNYASEGTLAMRDLWAKTAAHLWDYSSPDRTPFVIQGERQELL